MGDSESRAKRRMCYVSVAVLLIAVIALSWMTALRVAGADDRRRERVGAVFAESVVSVSQVLGTPDSPSAELAWHEGTGPYSAGCAWVRSASWRLERANPEELVRRLESVVEPLIGGQLLNTDVTGDNDWWDLDGATRYEARRGNYEIWMKGGVEDGGRFGLAVYDGAC